MRRAIVRRGRSASTLLVACLAIVLLLGALIILRMNRFPAPTGAYAVGEMTLAPDLLALSADRLQGPSGAILPNVHLWYPAQPADGASWFKRIARYGRANSAVADAKILPGTGRFPVVVYFPGWPGTAIDNYSMICNLVSHGFIVAGIIYPARLATVSDETFKAQVRQLEGGMDYSSEAAYGKTLIESSSRVSLRAHDAGAVLDTLQRLDAAASGSRLAQRIDLTRAGLLGFSLGGAVAAEASTIDPRFRAVVNMDGRHWGNALQGGVKVPYLYMSEVLVMPTDADLVSTNADTRYNGILDRIDYTRLDMNLARNGGTHVTVRNTEHLDFTDHVLHWSKRRLFGMSPIDPQRALHIANSYVQAFFEAQLANRPAALLTANPSPYPEVTIEIFAPPVAP